MRFGFKRESYTFVNRIVSRGLKMWGLFAVVVFLAACAPVLEPQTQSQVDASPAPRANVLWTAEVRRRRALRRRVWGRAGQGHRARRTGVGT